MGKLDPSKLTMDPTVAPQELLDAMVALSEVDEASSIRMDVAVFKREFLPLFLSTDDNVSMAPWIQYCNNPYVSVDVYAGNELVFTIPPIFNRHPTLVKGASSNSAALISAEARSRATQHPKLGERYLLENMSRKIQKLEIDMDSVRQFDKMLAYFGEPTLFNKSTPLTPPPGMQPTETFDDDDFEEA